MRTTNHVQCKLRRGTSITTSWLPQRYAVPGKHLRLRDEQGAWEDGWEVVETGSIALTDEVMLRSQDYKKQREASDI